MILISEDVWGTPFQALEGSFPITRNDDLWSNPDPLNAPLKDVTAIVLRNRTQVTAVLNTHDTKLRVTGLVGGGGGKNRGRGVGGGEGEGG